MRHAHGLGQRGFLRNDAAPIVTDQCEVIDAQGLDHGEYILGQGLLAVGVTLRRAGRVSQAAQIGRDHVELGRKMRQQRSPGRTALRPAMNEYQGAPVTLPAPQREVTATRVNPINGPLLHD